MMTGSLSTVVDDVSDMALGPDHVTVRHYKDRDGKRGSEAKCVCVGGDRPLAQAGIRLHELPRPQDSIAELGFFSLFSYLPLVL